MPEFHNQLVQCVYSSASSQPFSIEELAALLEVARSNNRTLNITGMLLYEKQSFFQILEGPSSAIDQVYRKIERDKRHNQITKILYHDIDQRVFERWSMGFADVRLKDLANLKGLNDFFRKGKCYADLDESKAKTLLTAFKEGKWHAKIT